jgi:hypothetical protein
MTTPIDEEECRYQFTETALRNLRTDERFRGVYEFAKELQRRLKIVLAECEHARPDTNDPNFSELFDSNEGRYSGIQKCRDILEDLIKAENEQFKEYMKNKKNRY